MSQSFESRLLWVRQSILPEPLEPIRRQGRVTDGRCDRAVAEIVLNGAGVLAVVGELVAARMAEHVRVDQEREARGLASPRNHALIASHAQGCQALGGAQDCVVWDPKFWGTPGGFF
jgi:hypothetical protein